MKYKFYFLFFFFCCAAFLIYSNSLNNEFVFDDIPLIVENREIKQLENIPELLGLTGKIPYYRPLRIASYAVDYHFYKLNPWGYHLSNIIFHIITAWLLFLIVNRLSKNHIIAAAAALLFITHPVNTESIAYISGRRDILTALFYLLGFYFFLKHRETKKVFWFPCILLSYLLALSSKEMAVTLPAMFFMYDLCFQPASEKKKSAGTFAGIIASVKAALTTYPVFYCIFFVGAAAFVYYKTAILPPSHGHEYYGGHLWTNFFTVARIIVYYLKLILMPVALNADYSFNVFPVTDSLADVSAWISIVIIFMMLWFAAKTVKKNRLTSFSIFWFFITLLPVCHIVPHHELLAEHYLYLPAMGIFLLSAVLIFNFLYKRSPFAFYAFFGIVLVLFSLRTAERNKDWKNALSLWKKATITAPECARAWNNLGVECYEAGDIVMAEKSYMMSKKIKPAYSDPWHNLGNIMADKNLFNKAREYYTSAYKYSQDSKKKEIFNSWGIVHKKTGNLKLAEQLFNRALRYDPFFIEATNNKAAVLYAQGKYWKAWGILVRGLKISPGFPAAHNTLGNVYKKTKNLQKAADEFREALRLKPDFMEARNNLGNVLKAEGLYDEAIEEYKLCLRLNPDSAEVYTNMGNTFRMAGQNKKAVGAFGRALELNPMLSPAHLNLALIYLTDIKDSEKALFHLKKTIEISPLTPQAEIIRKKIAEIEKN